MSGFNGYLRRNRYGIYAYRRVLPEAARACFGGRAEFIRSLATRSRRDAILLAQQLNLQVEESIPRNDIQDRLIFILRTDAKRMHPIRFRQISIAANAVESFGDSGGAPIRTVIPTH